MQLRNITLAQFTDVVAQVSAENYDHNVIVHHDAREDGVRVPRVVGRIRVENSRESGARTSWSGRRTVSACWHAHRDVFREIFAQYPETVIVTALARYTADTFEDVYPSTAYNNIGSMAAPAYMPQLCDC